MLFRLSGLRRMAESIGVTRIDLGERGGRMEFKPEAEADSAALLKLIHRHPQDYQLAGPTRLRINVELENGEERAELCSDILNRLTPFADNVN
jgi:transcription-repair coupling factor (superfamily II helicase)